MKCYYMLQNARVTAFTRLGLKLQVCLSMCELLLPPGIKERVKYMTYKTHFKRCHVQFKVFPNFTYLPALLLETYFRILLNIYDGVFCKNSSFYGLKHASDNCVNADIIIQIINLLVPLGMCTLLWTPGKIKLSCKINLQNKIKLQNTW